VKTPGRTAWKKPLAAAAALFWSVFGLLWAQLLVLKNPVLPPPFFVDFLSEIPATTRNDLLSCSPKR
jgi:hypothetical protein